MRIKIAPVLNPLTGEMCCFVEVFDARVLSARPAIPAIQEDEKEGIAARAGEPAYLGTVSCIARFYDANGSQIGISLRNDKTALSPEQYAKWDSTIDNDDAYFADCVVANLGFAKAA